MQLHNCHEYHHLIRILQLDGLLKLQVLCSCRILNRYSILYITLKIHCPFSSLILSVHTVKILKERSAKFIFNIASGIYKRRRSIQNERIVKFINHVSAAIFILWIALRLKLEWQCLKCESYGSCLNANYRLRTYWMFHLNRPKFLRNFRMFIWQSRYLQWTKWFSSKEIEIFHLKWNVKA